MDKEKITIEATINAGINKTWDLYTQPEHITQWNFASDDWQCPKVENDFRPEGNYLARMEAKDGSFGFDFKAVYDEIIPFEKIVYTIEDGREVNTTFEDLNGTTKVKTMFDAENQNPIEMQKSGWQEIMNNFKKYVEK